MTKLEVCEATVIHEEVIELVKEKLPTETDFIRLASFYKSFSDVTRLKILSALSKSEMCVCDLAFLISMSQSAVSHQLQVLRQSKLVKTRRDGKVVYYSLDDEHVRSVIEKGLSHVLHG
jgi:ArsR family transcriptional regulator